jgi:hypothetical protein
MYDIFSVTLNIKDAKTQNTRTGTPSSLSISMSDLNPRKEIEN